MQQQEIDLHALFKAVDDSLGVECRAAQPLPGGSNNRLIRLETRDPGFLVAKVYFTDDRHRLAREFGVLSALNRQGFTEVPCALARFDPLETAVYSYMEGSSIPASAFTASHIEQIAAYLAKLHGLTREVVKEDLPMAYASARSLGEVVTLIRDRFVYFAEDKRVALPSSLQRFLFEERVIERVEALLGSFLACHEPAHLEELLPPADLRLTSIDFGAHNMLWRADGSLVVLDFEYGGWDHPLRVIADFLAHDVNQTMGAENAERFVTEYLRRSPLGENVLRDLSAYRYLSQLEWTMVCLTSMLPHKLAQLAFAKGSSFDAETYIEAQIKKTAHRLAQLAPFKR